MTTYDLRIGATFDTSSSCSDHSLSNTDHDVETGTAVLESNNPNGGGDAYPSKQLQSTSIISTATSPTQQQHIIDSKRKQQRQRIGMLVVGVSVIAIAMFFIGLHVGKSSGTGNEFGALATPTNDAENDNNNIDDSMSSTTPIIPSEDVVPDDVASDEQFPEADEVDVTTTTTTTSSSSAATTQQQHDEHEHYIPDAAIPNTASSPTPKPITSSLLPTASPTTSESPTKAPTPKNPYFFGEEFITVPSLGIEMSTGLNVKLIALTGQTVTYGNGESRSNITYHTRSDAAGIIPLDPENPTEGGYVYMSNSEEDAADGGGVYGLYFDKYGNITDYKALLTGTTDNCGGGLTPWHTWVSCEENDDDGQCWQVSPDGRAEQTVLGGEGGNFESVAVDDRVYDAPVFYTTEDAEDGALRRYVATQYGWNALHSDDDGEHSFLNILDDTNFEWTTDEKKARKSAEKYFPKSEGIQLHEGKVYFMSKELQHLIILDLENMTYTSEESGKKFYGEGSFGGQPDQNMFGPSRKYIYFTEDGSEDPGVYARYDADGTYFTMFQAIAGGVHTDDETVGIALSPDHKRFYAGFQVNGFIFEFTRVDGLAFE